MNINLYDLGCVRLDFQYVYLNIHKIYELIKYLFCLIFNTMDNK